MSDKERAKVALTRIRSIHWDFDEAKQGFYLARVKDFLACARSVRLQSGSTSQHPIFDVVSSLGLPDDLPGDIKNELDIWSDEQMFPHPIVRDICRWYVHAQYMQDEIDALVSGGARLYDPLVECFEHGGYFTMEHGYIGVGLAGLPIFSRKDPSKIQ